MCITSYVFSLVTPLPSSLLHTYAVGLSYWQYQQAVRSQATADCQLLPNADSLATAFCFIASCEQAVCYNKFSNYMPPLLTYSYSNKTKRQICATEHMEIFATVGSGYHLGRTDQSA